VDILLATATDLSAEARTHGHAVLAVPSSGAAILVALDGGTPQLAVVSCDPAVLTATVLSACDAKGIRVIGLIGSDAHRRHAAVLGLHETVDDSGDWASVERAIAGQQREARPASGRGTVVAVWGPAGAPGRSSIATGIAAELAATGSSVVLGDVDTHAASIAPSLGLLDEAPGFAAACRLAGADSLTVTELERVAQRYQSGHGSFRVLTGLGRPTRWPELSHDRVAAVIEACRGWVDYTVLDAGASLENDEEISSDLYAPRRNAATITAVREADIVVAVAAADPVGLSRFLRAHVELVELRDDARIVVVANKLRATAIGMNPSAQVRQTLSRFGGIESPVLVPYDQSGMDGALLSARTLAEAAPRSPARLAIQELVKTRILAGALRQLT
jgi:MinD-like ATPase involved in chromosome partitioning or flagellar assembly